MTQISHHTIERKDPQKDGHLVIFHGALRYKWFAKKPMSALLISDKANVYFCSLSEPGSVAVRADATPDPRIICRHAALENTLISCPFRVNLKNEANLRWLMRALLGMQHMALATEFSSLSNMKCNKICQKSHFSFDVEWISKYRVVSSKREVWCRIISQLVMKEIWIIWPIILCISDRLQLCMEDLYNK